MATPAHRKRAMRTAFPALRVQPSCQQLGAGGLLLLVMFSLPVAAAPGTPCPGIHVDILNIRNSTGSVACALFESPEGFPREFLLKAMRVVVIKVNLSHAQCDFQGIPPGRYAMAVIHDENTNGKLDTNALGVPTEGYGFSNNAQAGRDAPTFAAASMPYDGRSLALTVRLHY